MLESFVDMNKIASPQCIYIYLYVHPLNYTLAQNRVWDTLRRQHCHGAILSSSSPEMACTFLMNALFYSSLLIRRHTPQWCSAVRINTVINLTHLCIIILISGLPWITTYSILMHMALHTQLVPGPDWESLDYVQMRFNREALTLVI